MVVAGVERKAVSPVEAELAGRGAGKGESGAVCVPSSGGSPVQKHRQLQGRVSVAACFWIAACWWEQLSLPSCLLGGRLAVEALFGFALSGSPGPFPFFIHRIDTVFNSPSCRSYLRQTRRSCRL